MTAETTQVDVDKMISKIYRDAMIRNSKQQFLSLNYLPESFPESMQLVLSRVLSFLPNTNHKGLPFIMSVSHNKRTHEYEIIVKNPKI